MTTSAMAYVGHGRVSFFKKNQFGGFLRDGLVLDSAALPPAVAHAFFCMLDHGDTGRVPVRAVPRAAAITTWAMTGSGRYYV